MIADEILNVLMGEATKILSQSLGTSKLEKFNASALGNMPYYWLDPNSQTFNSKTYSWISANLKAKTYPVQLDQPFTNTYINVFNKVSYALSSHDQAALTAASDKATNEQGALLNTWNRIYGGFPDGKGQPIDRVVAEICSNWASPRTTLANIQNSKNVYNLLNAAPASGKSIIPLLSKWLAVMGESISLIDNSTLNTSYLSDALNVVSTPTVDNGGIVLSGDNNTYHPAFKVSTEVSDILNALDPANADKSKITLSMDIQHSTENEFSMSVNGGARFSFPVLDFLSINIGGNANYFQSNIAKSGTSTNVVVTFTGVNLVNFGPVGFDMVTEKGWYWPDPIIEAIKNGNSDVSGFKFSPKPEIDFSTEGSFGFLTGAAISNYPSITITTTSSQYDQVVKDLNQSSSLGLSFLGIPLGINASESSYSHSVTQDSSNQTITITFNPPEKVYADYVADSTAWVLGVQTNYPCADANS